jgi:hypothetical protein
MSKKVIIERKNGEPHDPASCAGIACQVANIWLRRSDPWQTLQAIEPGTKYASVASLGEWALCEVVVDEQRAAIWERALAPLHKTLESHRAEVSRIGASFAAFGGVFDALATAHRDDSDKHTGLADLAREVRSFDLYNLDDKLFDCLEVVFDIEYCQRGLELSG